MSSLRSSKSRNCSHFPKPHAIVSIAKEKNIEIISDIELLGRSQRLANMVGNTGTNGSRQPQL